MKSPAFLIVALVVAIMIFSSAVIQVISPIITHYWAKYQHFRMIENRRKRFYSEIKALMAS
jgi:hypothetical protein